MSKNILPARIRFFQSHYPAMDAGVYSLTLTERITHADIADHNSAQLTRRFAVFGERFSLTDQDVRAIFPAAGSTGAYANVLPHIVLHRNTLPWERRAHAQRKSVPWLALLLFDEEERPEKHIITVKALYSGAGGGHFPRLTVEAAQHDDDKLTVIDVAKPILERILPDSESLALLAHCRQGVDADDQPLGEENAVVLCNRLPQPGKRSTMHLVSLEGRYDDHGFVYSGSGEGSRFVSLKSWEFYTTTHFKITGTTIQALEQLAPPAHLSALDKLVDREFAGTEEDFLQDVAEAIGADSVPESYRKLLLDESRFDKTFNGLLMNLQKDMMTLRLPPNVNVEAEKYLSQGLVPLPHSFRNGDRSVSWYRSPFVPFGTSSPAAAGRVRALNAETADELTQFDGERGMFDVTYSAAWELGRLLALANKEFSVSLMHWKRLLTQHGHRALQRGENEHLPVFSHGVNHESLGQLWESHLQPWLERLAGFENVPGNYLLPDQRLLPTESIRFFRVDRNWQTAALMGAFSIGGDWDESGHSAGASFGRFLDLPDSFVTGFLLRSEVLEGWPGVLVSAIDVNGDALEVVRRQLARNVLLCLFKGELKQVVFHQKPEVLHFGLTDESNAFSKEVRTSDGDETGRFVPVEWQGGEGTRVVDMDALANSLGKAGKPAQFAMNMVEGAPRVRFRLA